MPRLAAMAVEADTVLILITERLPSRASQPRDSRVATAGQPCCSKVGTSHSMTREAEGTSNQEVEGAVHSPSAEPTVVTM